MIAENCKESVWSQGVWHSHQCSRKAWKDGYCKQHHPNSVKARQEKSERHYEEKRTKSPWHQLQIERDRTKELEEGLRQVLRCTDGDRISFRADSILADHLKAVLSNE